MKNCPRCNSVLLSKENEYTSVIVFGCPIGRCGYQLYNINYRFFLWHKNKKYDIVVDGCTDIFHDRTSEFIGRINNVVDPTATNSLLSKFFKYKNF